MDTPRKMKREFRFALDAHTQVSAEIGLTRATRASRGKEVVGIGEEGYVESGEGSKSKRLKVDVFGVNGESCVFTPSMMETSDGGLTGESDEFVRGLEKSCDDEWLRLEEKLGGSGGGDQIEDGDLGESIEKGVVGDGDKIKVESVVGSDGGEGESEGSSDLMKMHAHAVYSRKRVTRSVSKSVGVSGSSSGGSSSMVKEVIGHEEVMKGKMNKLAAKAKEMASTSGGNSVGLAIVCEDGEEVDENESLGSELKVPVLMKTSKKIGLTKIPRTMADLFKTGLMEGLTVYYRSKNEVGLRGTVKGQKILCSCSKCHGSEVITAGDFEIHAGSKQKKPARFIYLDNGKTLHEIVGAFKTNPLESLEATIRNAISSNPVKSQPRAKSCFLESNARLAAKPRDHGSENKGLQISGIQGKITRKLAAKPRDHGSENKVLKISGIQGKITKKLAAMPRDHDSENKVLQISGIQGKITKKDLRLHKLVFQEDVLPEGAELIYYVKGKKILEGSKKGLGIFCTCCDTVVSASKFEEHAGHAARRKPYHNIYTSIGVCLHELSVRISRERNLSDDGNENDDVCFMCKDVGDLLCCDGCPRVYHQECVGLSSVPEGKWFCQHCQNMYEREKACESNANAWAAGRVAGVDPIEQITNRCIRIIKTSETETACIICRDPKFLPDSNGFGLRTVIFCDQCGKEYHVGCLKECKMADLKKKPVGKWFCCSDCQRIDIELRKLVARRPERLQECISNAIAEKFNVSDKNADLDIRWSFLSGKNSSPESNLVLDHTLKIFEEQFDPIIKAGCNLIPFIVKGNKVKDEDYGGMYCAILTVNSRVVSAATIRIFGAEVAEIPLAATILESQGKGCFQALFSIMERILGDLKVKNLVLPGADGAGSIWTGKFGFDKMTDEQLKMFKMNNPSMTVFEGTSMLHKLVPPSHYL